MANKTTSLQDVKKDTAYLLQNERRQRGMLASPTVEDNYIQRMRDKALQNLALIAIAIASAAMSTMALDPTKLINYMAGALTFQSAFYSTLVLVVFMCLVLGFLLLHLSGMENKTEVMMLIQSLLGLAIIVSIIITLCAFVLKGITELVN